jgi:hypothetical protein
MHHRHWVGRNRGKNLNYSRSLRRNPSQVNLDVKTGNPDHKPPVAIVIASTVFVMLTAALPDHRPSKIWKIRQGHRGHPPGLTQALLSANSPRHSAVADQVMIQKLVIGIVLLSLGRFSSAAAADCWNAGPLFDEFKLTLAAGERTEVLGPLFNSERRESVRQWAVLPLCSAGRDDDTDWSDFDFLYPLLTYDRYGGEYRFQIFQLLSFAGGRNQEDTRAKRFTLFPFYFQQRSVDPTQHYTAVLPFYGDLQGRLFRDEIHFVMFPAYSRTRKKDVITEDYCFPFYHRRRGDGLEGWQFWPFYGAEHKVVTTRTNGFGDVEAVGGHDKHFVAWPFFLDPTLGLGTENPEHQQALLPFYTYTRSPQRDSTSYLWPLGVTITDDRARQYHEVDAPWPLIVFAHGEGKTTKRVWPFFSHAASTNQQSDFWLWPLYKYNRLHSEPLDRDRTRILFYLYSRVNERNTDAHTVHQRTDLWPLFTHHRDFNGDSRLQLLAPIEPILPNNKSIERNYSPLWSVWRAGRNAQTGAASQSFLWNLYRRESAPEARKCSLLFGLFQYESDSQGRRGRLFYVPFGQRAARATPRG